MTATEIFENIEHTVVSLAAIIGGLWVLSRLNGERTDEAALEMKVSTTSSPLNGLNVAMFAVRLTNKGKTKIAAKTEQDAEGMVFNDGAEKHQYACSLLIRRLDPAGMVAGQCLDWFEGGPWTDLPIYRGQNEANLLLDYQNPKAKERVEFWMEPREVYRLAIPVVLAPGIYLAKVTFVGADQEKDWLAKFLEMLCLLPRQRTGEDENFWSQIHVFTIPAAAQTLATEKPV